MFNAQCVDAASSEPLPPEREVEYMSAPGVELPASEQP